MENDLSVAHGDVPMFTSLASFRAAHTALLRRSLEEEGGSEFLSSVETFLEHGQAIGSFLVKIDDRWDTQSLLDYWVTVLFQSDRRPDDVSLAEFDLTLVRERVCELEEMYQALTLEEQEAVKRIVLQVIQPEGEDVFSCSRVFVETLYSLGRTREQIDLLLDGLIDANFLHRTLGKTPGESQIEVAFESLASCWKRLIVWLDEEREARRKRQPLTDAAQRWADMGRDPGILCSGKLLVQALDFPNLGELETEFVRASLIACLKEGEGGNTEWASPQLVRLLIELLSDRDQDVCFRAEYALKCIVGKKPDLAPPAITSLIDRLASPNGEVRARTASVLTEMVRIYARKVTSETVDVLVELLRDPDSVVSSQIAYALEWVAVARSGLTEKLAIGVERLLVDSCGMVRARAAGLLEEVVRVNPNTATLQMAETLVKLYRDPDDQVNSRAQYALERIVTTRPDLALKVAELLDDFLVDTDIKVRVRAVHTLDEVVRADSEMATLERVVKLGGLLRDGCSAESLQAEHLLKRMLEARPQLAYQIANLESSRFSPVFPWYTVSLIRGISPNDVNSPSSL